MIVFLNGKFLPAADAVVPLNDRGFLLGDGLFETMRVANGKPFRCAQHLERLTRGADFLKIKLPFTPKEIQKFAVELIEQNKLSEAIRGGTRPGGAGGGVYPQKNPAPPPRALTLHPLPRVNGDEPVQ